MLISLLVKRWLLEWWLCAYPSFVRWLLFEWFCAYPSFVRLIFVWLCALPLSVEVVLLERGVMYSLLYLSQILSGGSLCGKSCVDELVEIFLWRRGRRAVCSNLETYLGVCVWSTFSNSLSLLHCALIHIVISYTCLVCLCASLVFNQESFI